MIKIDLSTSTFRPIIIENTHGIAVIIIGNELASQVQRESL